MHFFVARIRTHVKLLEIGGKHSSQKIKKLSDNLKKVGRHIWVGDHNNSVDRIQGFKFGPIKTRNEEIKNSSITKKDKNI